VTWQANAVGSARVFEAVSAAGVGVLVYASPVGAYSPGPGRRADESRPTHSVPAAASGREKAYVERLLDAFEARQPDTRVVRLRPAFIFQREAASEQRRIFAGLLLPGSRLRPGRLPVVPQAGRTAVSGRCTPTTSLRPTGWPSSATGGAHTTSPPSHRRRVDRGGARVAGRAGA
jgi:hypothetical protein